MRAGGGLACDAERLKNMPWFYSWPMEIQLKEKAASFTRILGFSPAANEGD